MEKGLAMCTVVDTCGRLHGLEQFMAVMTWNAACLGATIFIVMS